MKLRLTVLMSAVLVAGAFFVGHVSARSGASYDIRVNDYLFARDAGVLCRDQLLCSTAPASTKPTAWATRPMQALHR
jgi:hypothetical protein